jgi:hypothetical protein
VLHDSTTFTVKQLLRLEQRVEVPERAFYPPRSHRTLRTLRGKGKSTELAQCLGIPWNTDTNNMSTHQSMEAALQLLLCGWFVGISSKPICINTVRISVFTCALRVMNPKGLHRFAEP